MSELAEKIAKKLFNPNHRSFVGYVAVINNVLTDYCTQDGTMVELRRANKAEAENERLLGEIQDYAEQVREMGHTHAALVSDLEAENLRLKNERMSETHRCTLLRAENERLRAMATKAIERLRDIWETIGCECESTLSCRCGHRQLTGDLLNWERELEDNGDQST